MGRYVNALKIVMGIAMPLSIPAHYLTEKFLKTGHTEVAHAIDKETTKGVLCQKVKNLLYYEVGDVTWEYVSTHPSSIGSSCYRNEEMVCARWLKDYYKWLADRALDELPDVEGGADKVVGAIKGAASGDLIPDMKVSLPGTPDLSGLKKSLQVSAIVFIGVILVIVWMLTGKGEKGI